MILRYFTEKEFSTTEAVFIGLYGASMAKTQNILQIIILITFMYISIIIIRFLQNKILKRKNKK